VIAYHWGAFQISGVWDRADYYGVYATPWVWFDGFTDHLGSGCTYANFRNTFETETLVPSPLSMQIELDTYDGSTGAGSVVVDITNESGSDISGYLRLVATGDHATGNWGYFNEVKSVALDIFPDAQGVPVTIPSGETFQTVQAFQLPSAPVNWPNELWTVVGFVQDDTTKEILQGAVLHRMVAVELECLTASVRAEGVVLSWSTPSEWDNAGFRVYRSEGAEYAPLFDDLILSTAVQAEYSYTDRSVEAERTYWYKIADVSLDGVVTFHGPIQVEVTSLQLVPLAVETVPTPARDSASLRFSVPASEFARLCVFDVRGRLVRELLASHLEAGLHVVQWDLLDEQGAAVSPGQYVCRLSVGHRAGSGKVVVTR
jgi:hypothetical protein